MGPHGGPHGPQPFKKPTYSEKIYARKARVIFFLVGKPLWAPPGGAPSGPQLCEGGKNIFQEKGPHGGALWALSRQSRGAWDPRAEN